MLALAAIVAAVPYFYHGVHEEIRARIEAKIAENYPDLIVHVRQAQLVEGKGIEVRGLSIAERGAVGPQAELAYFDEVLFTCQTTMQDLIKGDPLITRTTIRRPIFRTTQRPDGTWSTAKLLPLPKCGPGRGETVVENGMVEIFDPLKNPASTFTLRDVNLTIKPAKSPQPDGAEPLAIEGYLAADQLQRIELKGLVDSKSKRWSLNGIVDGAALSPELRSALPASIADRLNVLGSLRCEGKLKFTVANDPAQQPSLRFDATAQVQRGHIDDPRLPFPLSNLEAGLRFNNDGFTVDFLKARNGPSVVELKNCRRQGYGPGSPIYLQLSGRRIPLDQNLVRALPPSFRKEWDKYLPEGEIDADLQLQYDGQSWTKQNVTIKCLNVSFTCHTQKFPYRLDHGTGSLNLQNRVLTVNMQAFSGPQPIQIDAEIHNPGPNFTGKLKAKGSNIPFDEKLLRSLNAQSEPAVRALHPQGTFNFFFSQQRNDPDGGQLHHHLHMELNRCSINYDRFQYPVANICGSLDMIDGAWTCKQLEGTNDTAVIKCEGTLEPGHEGKRLTLTFRGKNVPLEDELRDALPLNMSQLWRSLDPRGAVDLERVLLTYDTGTHRMAIEVDAKPIPDKPGEPGGLTSIEPAPFPYRFDRLRGAIHYKDGHLDLTDIKAVHGRTEVATGGSCDIYPNGGFLLKLRNLEVDRLQANHELIAALPTGLKRLVGDLKPTGAINLRGGVDFSKKDADAPLESAWDAELVTQHTSLDAGVRLENVCGSARLTGAYGGEKFYSQGELKLDAVTYKNFQFTEIAGPVWIDNTQVRLGRWADAQVRSKSPRSISAKIFGGTVLGDCHVALDATPQYTLRATLADGDLAQFAKENISGQQDLKGQVVATIDLGGTGRSKDTLRGDGKIRLRDAEIYELPIMVALLKILSVSAAGYDCIH